MCLLHWPMRPLDTTDFNMVAVARPADSAWCLRRAAAPTTFMLPFASQRRHSSSALITKSSSTSSYLADQGDKKERSRG